MRDALYLGVDCGTQGTKAVVLDVVTGEALGIGSASHTLVSEANGRREQDPAQWTAAFEQATRAAISQAGIDGRLIKAIGVSGQQHGLVALDEAGHVLRPAKLWCDTESSAENDALLDQLGGTQGSLERLGIAIAPGYTLSKLPWMRERFPALFERIAHILLPHDYLNFWLTGRYCAEYGDASGTGYFNIRSRQWDRNLLNQIDPTGRLEHALPPLIEADQPVGTLRPALAERLGLSPDVIVSSGGGDNMMGAIGTGNITPGVVTMSLGTSGTLYAYSDTPVVSDHASVAAFCSSSGGWLPLICTMNLTNANAAIRDLLEIDLDEFNRLLGEAPIGAEGVVMLPFLNGERVPALPHGTASLHGLTTENLTRANLCRAVVEGVTFGLRHGLDLLRASGIQSQAIRVIGGGSNNALWRQVVADIMNTPVVRTTHSEAAALGGAIQAAWCEQRHRGLAISLEALCERCVTLDEDSRVEPIAPNVERYQKVYQTYQAHIQALYGHV
ncbi:xylulokinase [Pseudomonas sp. Marseille-QA0892]